MNKIKQSTNVLFTLLSVFALLLAACGQATVVPIQSTNQAPLETTQASTETSALPITGNGPAVIVNDQSYDGTNVMVAKVISKGPGWMAIHNQQNGHLGPVIGHTHVNDGENDNVIVKIDPSQATPVMYAMLHIDAGVIGTYEFPGPDVPVMMNGQMLSPAFKATVNSVAQIANPVVVHDQDVSTGRVMIDKVVSSGPGWIAIHVQNPDGSPGKEIGYTAVKNGVNQNVTVTIDASQATPVLFAMLHTDAGVIGMYEYPGPDMPVMVNGQMVAATFKNTAGGVAAESNTPTEEVYTTSVATMSAISSGATPTEENYSSSASTPTEEAYTSSATAAPTAMSMGTSSPSMVVVTPGAGMTPLVKISDQEIQNGTVKVDDVISSGPGWVVIYTVTNGQPDQLIGHAPVHDGDNPNVTVQIDASKATDMLYAQLHVDAGQVGVFEFPGPDAPVMLGVKMISGMFKTSVGSGMVGMSTAVPGVTPSITLNNQPIHDGTIVVSQVVSVGTTWMVIHPRNQDGTPGDMIGFTLVHDGVNNNVLVHIDVSRATREMYGMLHVDVSKGTSPAFPGPDQPVMVNGKMLLPQFKVIGSLTGDVPVTFAKTSAGIPYLADAFGMAFYTNLNDSPGQRNCTGDCLTNWRPLLAAGALNPGAGIQVGKLGLIVLPDGSRQVTYAGLPLYYYDNDKNPGDINGQGLNGIWFLATP